MATARKRVLDFTNVKDKGNFNPKQVKEGPHKAKIIGVEEGTSKADNEQWIFSVVLPEYPSAVFPYYCTLTADSLWKLRNLVIACGVDLPKKRINIDPAKLVGKSFIAEMMDDEYEGRIKSKIEGVMSLADYKKFMEENDEDDEPKKKRRPEPEDDDEDDEEPEPPKKKRRPVEDDDDDEPAPKKKKKKAPVDDDDDEEIDLDNV